jgi:hypothetical protein
MKKSVWSCVYVSAAVIAFAVLPGCIDSKTSDRAEDSEPPAVDRSLKEPALSEQASGSETLSITGQMTLLDIERSLGVSATDLAEKLDLPPDVSKDETLGMLRQTYPFTMDRVRDLVAEHARGAGSAAMKIEHVSERTDHATSPEEPQLARGRGAEAQTGVLITGQMTLREIESRSGVSARLIAEKLGLPPVASLETPLGKLRRTYRFTMQDVRSIVADQLNNTKLQPSPPRDSGS